MFRGNSPGASQLDGVSCLSGNLAISLCLEAKRTRKKRSLITSQIHTLPVTARPPNQSYISIIEQFVHPTQTQDSAVAAALTVSRNAYFFNIQGLSVRSNEDEGQSTVRWSLKKTTGGRP
jgi:hypothetical protein